MATYVTGRMVQDETIDTNDLQQGVAIPPGAVMSFAMSAAPVGWLPCDGAAISRTTYASLFAVVGVIHGAGDGSNTFNVPDLRGIFIRGSGSQTISGVTYNKAFAVKEQDALQGHRHLVKEQDGSQVIGTTLNATGGGFGVVEATTAHGGINRGNTEARDIITDGTNGTPRATFETRPVNIALLYCIKF